MDPGLRRIWILCAAIIALVFGVLAGWVVYQYHRSGGPEPVAEQVQTPPATPPVHAVLPELSGQILVAGCRQGECRWSRVVKVESLATVPQGELRRMTLRGGASTYADEAPESYSAAVSIQWDPSDRSEYAFCSHERPAFAFPGDTAGYLLHYLDLYDLAGFQLASARAYMRICHNLPFDGDDPTLLQRLGYRPGTRNEQVEHGQPEDLARF